MVRNQCEALTKSSKFEDRCKRSVKSGLSIACYIGITFQGRDGYWTWIHEQFEKSTVHSHYLCAQHHADWYDMAKGNMPHGHTVDFRIDTRTCDKPKQEELPMEIENTPNPKMVDYVHKLREEFTMNETIDQDFLVCGTGSRHLVVASPEVQITASRRLEQIVLALKMVFGDRLILGSGMAQGFDTGIARIAIKHNIRLWCFVPTKDYGDYYWGPRGSLVGDKRKNFWDIIHKAEKVIYVKEDVHGITDSGVYLDTEMATASWRNGPGRKHANFVRNDEMVAQGDFFLVWDPRSRGTADCFTSVKRARKPYNVVSAGLEL